MSETRSLNAIKGDLGETKRLAIKRIEHLTGESEWNLLQQICQDIEADFIVSKKGKLSNQKLLDLMRDEVKHRYGEQADMISILEEAIPSMMTISVWRKKKGWEDAVWFRVRGEGLFTNDQRSAVIGKLFQQAAVDGNVQAAKIWLTLSGDYQEKDTTSKNDVVDIFKSINETIHSKK